MDLVLLMGRTILGPVRVDGLALVAWLSPTGYYWAVFHTWALKCGRLNTLQWFAWLVECLSQLCCFGPCGWLRCLNMSLCLIALARSKDDHGYTDRFCRWHQFASITTWSVGRHAQSIIMCNLESFSAKIFIVWSEEILAQEQEWLSAYQDVIAISNGRSWSGQVVVKTVR